MPEVLDIIFEFVESFRPDITKNQQDKGLRASGASALSLRTRTVNDNVVQLIDGSGAFKFQDTPGRGPSKGGSSSGKPLHKIIYEWLSYRKYGFNWSGEKQRVSMSYAIANKIHEQGNFIHRTGKSTGVVKELITENRIKLLREQIGGFYARGIVDGYFKAFGQN